MEKRAVIAIAISFLILLGWSWLFPPAPPAPRPATVETPAERPPAAAEAEPREATALPSDPPVQAAAVAAAAQQELPVENRFFSAVLTNEGGRVLSWRLRDYKDEDGNELELITRYAQNGDYPLAIALDDTRLADELNQALFEVERIDIGSRDGLGRGETIRFRWSDGQGLEATKALTFWETGWLVDAEVEVRDRGRRLNAGLSVGPGFTVQNAAAGNTTYYFSDQALWYLDGSVTRRKGKSMAKAPGEFSGNVRWAGLEDQYFAALIVPRGGPVDVAWTSIERAAEPVPGAEAEAEVSPRPIVSVGVPEAGAQLYFGPKNFRTLAGLQTAEMEKAVWFSSNSFLAAISKYIFFALLWIHDHVAPNYGLAIILATFVLRVLLFPVNQYSMVSMKKAQIQMQRLQPKIKAIRAKYKKAKDAQSRQKMQEETMALYKREGVNPMGGLAGCLPMLAQFPILIGFYNMLTVAVELRGAPFFGWIQDLSLMDPFWVMPVLMAVTMFVQQKLAMTKVTDPMQQQQQKMMLFMPVVFGGICIQMPAGMVMYWFINNLLGIGQQWLVNRHTGKLEAAAQKA